jgi:hypothetical protein
VWHRPQGHATGCRLLGGAATEQEVNRGSEAFAFQVANDSPGRRQLARILVGRRRAVLATKALAAHAAPAHTASQFPADAAQTLDFAGQIAAGVEDGGDFELVFLGIGARQPVAMLERHRAFVVEHAREIAVGVADPFSDLGRIGHRRRQAHQRHVPRREQDRLLPRRAALRVAHVMHLIEDDGPHVLDAGPSNEHVAQHFGCHN